MSKKSAIVIVQEFLVECNSCPRTYQTEADDIDDAIGIFENIWWHYSDETGWICEKCYDLIAEDPDACSACEGSGVLTFLEGSIEKCLTCDGTGKRA